MQVVHDLGEDSSPQIRFQLSQNNTWIEAKGRIAWTDDSKKTAGVEFIDVPFEGRGLINDWIASVTTPAVTATAAPLVEELPAELPASSHSEPSRSASTLALNAGVEPAGVSRQHSAARAPITYAPTVGGTRKIEPFRVGPPLTLLTSGNVRRKIRAPFYLSSDLSTRALEEKINPRRTRQLIGIALLAVFLPSALIFLAFRMKGTLGIGLHTSEVTAAAKETELPANAPAVPKSVPVNSKTTPVAVNLPLDHPGFILQVGAMRHGENASALAESLRERNFPAFVWRLGTDRLYRVVVGPYSDVESTMNVKEDLKNQGFDSIRMEWNPKGEQNSTLR